MKKINILITLILVLLIGLAQPVYADAWDYANNPSRFQISFDCCASEAAHVNAAMAKFNGLLNAYTSTDEVWNQPIRSYSITKQFFSAAHDLSDSLGEFNTALVKIYPTLSEEKQFAVRNAYSSLGLYLEELVAETNSVFDREVFRIESRERTFEGQIDTFKEKILDFIDAISF